MGEQKTPAESSEWRQAKELVDSLSDTTEGRLMAEEPMPGEDTLREPEMRAAEHALSEIENMGCAPGSALSRVLERLQESGKVALHIEPYLVDGRPSAGGWVRPVVDGVNEVEQEREAHKISAFLKRHEDLIKILSPNSANKEIAAKMEANKDLPEGWTKRLEATYMQFDKDFAQDRNPDQVASATAALDQLKAAGVEPLGDDEIAQLIDTTIAKDELRGELE